MNEFLITEDFPKNEAEFDRAFSDERACREYLFKCRWPDGFVCPKCGCGKYWQTAKGLYMCYRCESQHSLTAGTIMHGTRWPLRAWFKAMWWFTTRKSGVNAVNLQDLLGFGSYNTAWSWLHKLRSCTVRHNREKLSGNIEADEFYLGGKATGKRGRGAQGKFAVAAAVERKGKKLGRIRLQVIEDCSGSELESFIQANVTAGSRISTDGWKGYNAIEGLGYGHKKILQTKTADKESVLPGVHLVASLIKRLILGTFQGRLEGRYLQHYLNEYVFRFNRRATKSVGKKFFRIVQQDVATKPNSHKRLSLEIACPLLAN
jgi:transposase-like protein